MDVMKRRKVEENLSVQIPVGCGSISFISPLQTKNISATFLYGQECSDGSNLNTRKGRIPILPVCFASWA